MAKMYYGTYGGQNGLAVLEGYLHVGLIAGNELALFDGVSSLMRALFSTPKSMQFDAIYQDNAYTVTSPLLPGLLIRATSQELFQAWINAFVECMESLEWERFEDSDTPSLQA